MTKIILSNQPLNSVDTFYSSFVHTIQVLYKEEVGTYLDFISKQEGYSSVESYLKSNPVWLYQVPDHIKLEDILQG